MTRKTLHLNVSLTILIIYFNITCFMHCAEERSVLDNFVNPYRIIRQLGFKLSTANVQITNNRQVLKGEQKLQPHVPDNKPFPCDLSLAKSATSPTSVHNLRVGDIQVVGAMGDSLTAGYGLTASSIVGVLLEERGMSFSIGGEENWRTYLTLPNILKQFNPNLVGYSLRASLSIQRESQFNVAEGGAVSNNMPYMAKVLIKRIAADKRVNFQKDWKMVTLMIGNNDFCSEMCYYKDPFVVLTKHKQDMIKTLRILKMHLPRTIVNVIPPPNLAFLAAATNKPALCHITHSVECPCLMGLFHRKQTKFFNEIMVKWQQLDIEIANDPEFDSDDFTVNVLPFFVNFTFPTIDNGQTLDYTFLSQDCFHFSQKGNAVVALELWNSILEPFGSKHTNSPESIDKFNCPTKELPFIFTRRNSPLQHNFPR